MEPANEYLQFCQSMMVSSQRLITELGERTEYLDAFLPGIIIVAFKNPLLRMVTINGTPYIAHVVPSGMTVRGMDNPLENNSQQGDLRARIYGNLGKMVAERNEGRKELDPIARELDQAMDRAGRESITPAGINLRAAEQYSNLLHATLPSFGSAFKWKPVTEYRLSNFKQVRITQRGDTFYDTPTFDLALLS